MTIYGKLWVLISMQASFEDGMGLAYVSASVNERREFKEANTMNKQRQAYLIGFIMGSSLVACAVVFVFLTTTITYKSSLFPGKHIALTARHVRN